MDTETDVFEMGEYWWKDDKIMHWCVCICLCTLRSTHWPSGSLSSNKLTFANFLYH